jgi:hypothetical protein
MPPLVDLASAPGEASLFSRYPFEQLQAARQLLERAYRADHYEKEEHVRVCYSHLRRVDQSADNLGEAAILERDWLALSLRCCASLTD